MYLRFPDPDSTFFSLYSFSLTLPGDPGSKGSKPEFMEDMANVTVFLGRTANIACTVKDLRAHRVSNENRLLKFCV